MNEHKNFRVQPSTPLVWTQQRGSTLESFVRFSLADSNVCVLASPVSSDETVRGSLGSELEKSCSRVLGYCVRCVRLPACTCVRACSCVCACKGGTVILPVTRCTQSLPAPPAFLRSSIYHLRVDPGQTGSEVQRRERSEPEKKFTKSRQGRALSVAGWSKAWEG